MTAHALIVVDLGFGDAGKGTLTDALAHHHGARLVVRFNGGAQAGHNVVTDDGRHHTFAQFGAASFIPGARTHLAAPFVLHPTALLVEARHLAAKGVDDPLSGLTVSPEALLITPYHQRLNHLRERSRGSARHGTCGVGVGETVALALSRSHLAIRAKHLASVELVERVRALREALRGDADLFAAQGDRDGDPFADDELPRRWASAARGVAGCVRDDGAVIPAALRRDRAVVFEGAQGVLLDEWHGFHPHTTWSNCTFDNALALLRVAGHRGETTRIGVLRSYSTRHGEGPLPTERADFTEALPEAHNDGSGWQGRFRAGPLDLVLSRYALRACGGADLLAVTHLDRVREGWPLCDGYEHLDGPRWIRDGSGRVRSAQPLGVRSLTEQAALGEALRGARPVFEACRGDPAERVAEALGVRVGWRSFGPRRGDKRV